jgi:hypothetical protein
VQKKISSVYVKCREAGMTDYQSKLVLGLIDHESAGTWDENTVGDSGCSHGIGQWNACVGRIAPATFSEQVDLIVTEMKDKFQKYDNNIAITKHNCPACSGAINYTYKVIKSSNQFK